jgi:hypothetical protein
LERNSAVSAARSRPFRVLGVLGELADADADRDLQLLIADAQRRLERHDQPRREVAERGERHRALVHDGELVAAEARAVAVLADDAAQPLADLLQDLVAELVAEAVVDDLEVVDVEEHDRDAAAHRARARDRVAEPHEQMPAVGQARQRVVLRQMLQVAGALGHLRLEPVLMVLEGRACRLQLACHVVERLAERVELARPAARHLHAAFAAGEAARRFCQALHGTGDAADRDDRGQQQQAEHRRGDPQQRYRGHRLGGDLLGDRAHQRLRARRCGQLCGVGAGCELGRGGQRRLGRGSLAGFGFGTGGGLGGHGRGVRLLPREPARQRADRFGDRRSLAHELAVGERVRGVGLHQGLARRGERVEACAQPDEPLLALQLREARGVLCGQRDEARLFGHEALDRFGTQRRRTRELGGALAHGVDALVDGDHRFAGEGAAEELQRTVERLAQHRLERREAALELAELGRAARGTGAQRRGVGLVLTQLFAQLAQRRGRRADHRGIAHEALCRRLERRAHFLIGRRHGFDALRCGRGRPVGPGQLVEQAPVVLGEGRDQGFGTRCRLRGRRPGPARAGIGTGRDEVRLRRGRHAARVAGACGRGAARGRIGHALDIGAASQRRRGGAQARYGSNLGCDALDARAYRGLAALQQQVRAQCQHGHGDEAHAELCADAEADARRHERTQMLTAGDRRPGRDGGDAVATRGARGCAAGRRRGLWRLLHGWGRVAREEHAAPADGRPLTLFRRKSAVARPAPQFVHRVARRIVQSRTASQGARQADRPRASMGPAPGRWRAQRTSANYQPSMPVARACLGGTTREPDATPPGLPRLAPGR